MAARSLLLKLDQRGWIALPPRRVKPTNRMRARVIAPRPWDTRPLVVPLEELGPLGRLPSTKIDQIYELLPGQWKLLPANTS
jgi:hypothetical protein